MGGFKYIAIFIENIFQFIVQGSTYGILLWILACIFLWSGFVKVRQPTLAAMAIVDFGITRHVMPKLGGLVGIFEIMLGIVLALGVYLKIVLIISILLLILFTTLIARSLWIGDEFPCFCFGNSDSKISRLTLFRTLFLVFIGIILYNGLSYQNHIDRSFQTAILQANIAVCVLGISMILVSIPKLIKWNLEPVRKDRK